MSKFNVYARHKRKLVKVEEIWTTSDCGFLLRETLSYTHPKFGKVFLKREL